MRYRRVLYSRTLCLLMLALAATTSLGALEGRLLGPEGAPLGGARVLIIGHSGSTVTDRDGVFSLDGDVKPPFQLLVTLPDGVALSPATVEEVPEEGLLEVQLEPIMAEAVTVISGIVPDLQLPPAAAASVIGRGELDQRAPTSLSDSLSSLPGYRQRWGRTRCRTFGSWSCQLQDPVAPGRRSGDGGAAGRAVCLLSHSVNHRRGGSRARPRLGGLRL